MPTHKIGVSPEELDTIQKLNRLVRAREVMEGALLKRGALSEFDIEARPMDCDACSKHRSLGSSCYNLVIDGQGVSLVLGKPMPDRFGCVIIRYHDHHRYVQAIARWVSAQYAKRRGQDADDLVEDPDLIVENA